MYKCSIETRVYNSGTPLSLSCMCREIKNPKKHCLGKKHSRIFPKPKVTSFII